MDELELLFTDELGATEELLTTDELLATDELVVTEELLLLLDEELVATELETLDFAELDELGTLDLIELDEVLATDDATPSQILPLITGFSAAVPPFVP